MQIGMLGPFEVRTGDGPVDVPGARLRGLLIALALRPGQPVPRTYLVDWIWGERPPVDATNALHRLVSRLRKLLPDGVIEGRSDGYRLLVDPDAVDAVRFERLVGAAQAGAEDGPRAVRLLRSAGELWRGAAMQDVGLQDSTAFDAVVVRLEGLRLTATEERIDAEVALGRGAELVTELTDLVAAHPLRERFAAALMRALAAAGRGNEALLVFQRTREALAEALGVDPSAELSALHVRLLRGEEGRTEERTTNLRAELTSFVGKDGDVGVVRQLVADHRLTTLIGPGGVGKTRLATESARTLLGEFPDGVWLVELAAVGADGDVAQSVLAGLGLRDALLGGTPDAQPTDRLVAAIRERKALLILDNCEHVIEAAAAFAHQVLGQCRRLRILATSREPLGIIGEALWLVEPLALPAAEASADEIGSAPAVQLLTDRARAVRRDLVVDDHTLQTMLRICRALDGVPLAIELAAARARTMSVEQLANGLNDRFRLLTTGSRTALPRHKTLHAVVDWSWQLLTDAERTVLSRLSVFAGGVGERAAERVCAGSGVGPDRVPELLTSLAEKSLLRSEGGSEPRYRMISTIREYAARRLADSGEADTARRAHLAHFTELAEAAEPHLRRVEQLEWLAVLGVEHDEIASALRGAIAAGEADAAMRLAAGAGWYWWLSGHKAEGIDLIVAATRVPGPVPDEIRAMVYALVVLFVSSGRGDAQQAEEWIHKAHRLGRSSRSHHPLIVLVAPLERMLADPAAFIPAWEPLLDDVDPWIRALARLHLGKMRILLGHGGRDADQYLETALAEFRGIGERFGMSFALTELAERAATLGEFARACEYYEQAITVVSEAGAVEDVIPMRSRQARLLWLLGDPGSSAAAMADAQRHAEGVTWPDALAELALARSEIARWSGDGDQARHHLGVATALLGDRAELVTIRFLSHDMLGYLAEDLDESREHRVAACAAAAEAGHPFLVAQTLVGVADLAVRAGEYEQAARLLAASTAVRGLPDRSNPEAARIERIARTHLGEDRFAEATLEGAHANWSELSAVTLAAA